MTTLSTLFSANGEWEEELDVGERPRRERELFPLELEVHVRFHLVDKDDSPGEGVEGVLDERRAKSAPTCSPLLSSDLGT